MLRQWRVLGYALFHVFYVVMHIFLNLAYYRYEAGPRLNDLGYLLVPMLPSRYETAAEVPMLLIVFLVVSTLAMSLYDSAPPGKLPKPYLANMGKRFVTCFAAGHTLRAATYLSTTLPGAAEHCLPGSEWRAAQPKDVADILLHQASPTSNCGDLVFSGHMLTVLLLSGCVFRYGQPLWRTSARATNALRGVCVLLCAAQALLILAARHHYTVDVVVALYTVPLLWSWWGHTFPDDLAPNDARIAAYVLGRGDVN